VRSKVLKRIGIGAGALVVVLTLLVATLYVYPLGSDRARTSKARTLSFEEAKAAGQAAVQRDTADSAVQSDCRTKLLVHPGRTAKSVLMVHGYTSCPQDYDQLAQLFYERGYNVYVPREAHHGLDDLKATGKLTIDGLLDYADNAMDITAGLGQEAGVIGASGGAVLATWLAENRTDTVHLLSLSPFYKPGPKQAPAFAVRPITVLFGFRLVPDVINERGFSFASLTQYLRIVRNYPDKPVNGNLRSVAVVRSAGDPLIDLDEAFTESRRFSGANGLTALVHEFPTSFGFEHTIVGLEDLGARNDAIDAYYLDLYEGRDTPAPS
jgi:pimeloyl-ACP methyl ester carboxylesterase